MIKKLSEEGNLESINFLGRTYEKGLGVPQNLEKSIELYTISADKGFSVS